MIRNANAHVRALEEQKNTLTSYIEDMRQALLSTDSSLVLTDIISAAEDKTSGADSGTPSGDEEESRAGSGSSNEETA